MTPRSVSSQTNARSASWSRGRARAPWALPALRMPAIITLGEHAQAGECDTSPWGARRGSGRRPGVVLWEPPLT